MGASARYAAARSDERGFALLMMDEGYARFDARSLTRPDGANRYRLRFARLPTGVRCWPPALHMRRQKTFGLYGGAIAALSAVAPSRCCFAGRPPRWLRTPYMKFPPAMARRGESRRFLICTPRWPTISRFCVCFCAPPTPAMRAFAYRPVAVALDIARHRSNRAAHLLAGNWVCRAVVGVESRQLFFTPPQQTRDASTADDASKYRRPPKGTHRP